MINQERSDMKKITALFFAIIVLLQLNVFTLKAEDYSRSVIITISDIDTSMLFNQPKRFTTEIMVNGVATTNIKIVSEKWLRPEEFMISSRDIPLNPGKYSYQLRVRSDGTLNFNNDLEVYYQGIDGSYKLDYAIDETDNHLMLVTGLFENIVTRSPALDILPTRSRNWVTANFSDDSYFYELDLATREGFTLRNNLQFMYKSIPNVYSVEYVYKLLNNDQALKVNGSVGSNLTYFGSLIASDNKIEDISIGINDYAGSVNDIAAANKELISRLARRMSQLPISEGLQIAGKVKEIADETRNFTNEIFGLHNIGLEERFKNIFDGFRH